MEITYSDENDCSTQVFKKLSPIQQIKYDEGKNSSENFFADSTVKAISEDHAKKLIWLANSCNCCVRHRLNRPVELCPYIPASPIVPDNEDYSCQCSCRHSSRYACRDWGGN